MVEDKYRGWLTERDLIKPFLNISIRGGLVQTRPKTANRALKLMVASLKVVTTREMFCC